MLVTGVAGVAMFCAGPRESGQRIVLTGSSTLAPLMVELGRAFEVQHPQIRVDVQTGGSSRGITDARRGVADLGMVSRSLKSEESDLQPFLVARDGICFIVHGDNPVRQISTEQVRAIYTGEVRNWQDVGGPASPLVVVHKAAGRSTQELFLQYFQLSPGDVRADVIIGDNEQGIKTVAGNRAAIGYVSIGTAAYHISHGAPIRALPLDGIPATVEAVSAGRYPLVRELNLVCRGQPSEPVAQFLRFVQSSASGPIIEEQYFVPATD
ncbi:MAG: phosphate ABC transporter substrate-binding protein [Planctomycetota bacterium]|nr:MAG: phosphate ABC transporter substrate-binding protein [Planctomycetota bacterium]